MRKQLAATTKEIEISVGSRIPGKQPTQVIVPIGTPVRKQATVDGFLDWWYLNDYSFIADPSVMQDAEWQEITIPNEYV